MDLTVTQQAELQKRYDAAYTAKRDTLTWADLYTVRHSYFEELRKEQVPVAVPAASQDNSGEQ